MHRTPDVYWTDQMAGAVMKVPLMGGTPTTVAAAMGPWEIALDATNVYWTSPVDGVLTAPKGGGVPTRVSLGGMLLPPAGIAVDAKNVYWGSNQMPSGLVAAPVHGGGQRVLYSTAPSTAPGPIAIDGSNVYWADMANSLHSGPLSGGTDAILETEQSEVVAIAVDDTSLYWVANGYPTPGYGSIMRLTPK